MECRVPLFQPWGPPALCRCLQGPTWSTNPRSGICSGLISGKHCNTNVCQTVLCIDTGCFFKLVPPKKLKYGKPRLGESTLTQIVLDTPNLAQIYFSVLRTFRWAPVTKNLHFTYCENTSDVGELQICEVTFGLPATNIISRHWHGKARVKCIRKACCCGRCCCCGWGGSRQMGPQTV